MKAVSMLTIVAVLIVPATVAASRSIAVCSIFEMVESLVRVALAATR